MIMSLIYGPGRRSKCGRTSKITTIVVAASVVTLLAVSSAGNAQPAANISVASLAASASKTSIDAPVVEKEKVVEIIVIGNPLGATDARDLMSPVEILSGNELLLRRASTLGETVNGLLGVSSTWFGPNAGRPVIRGLEGDRVRVLSNLGSSLDASSLSFDHNPAIDPLAVERIEVLRGPVALLYGGTAIGGVVNVIDNRIPGAPINGARGAVEIRAGGTAKERATSVLLEVGNQLVSVHVDGFKRDTDDYRVPANTAVSSPVVNSSAGARGGAFGASLDLLNGKGNFGISQSLYESNYGTVAEADVRIDMRQTRTAAELNLRGLAGSFVDGVFVKASHSDYKHIELENGSVGTTFKNTGNDIRAELKHVKLGVMQGVVGLQSESFRFSAVGEEAFVPETKTRNHAVFAYEEIVDGATRYALGARLERSRIESDGAVGNAPARFGAASARQFSLGSASLGASHRLNRELTFTGNIALNERAPTYNELFANGAHLATAAYELGNSGLGKEKSTAIDVGFNWVSGPSNAKVALFMQSFGSFLALRRSGVMRDHVGNGGGTISVRDCGNGTSVESGCTSGLLPEYRYQQVSVKLSGVEAQVAHRVLERSASRPYTFDVIAKFDYVRAQDRTNGEPLPRISPVRLTIGATVDWQQFVFNTEIMHANEQKRVPQADSFGATPGYTLLSASAQVNFTLGTRITASVFLRGTNLTNARAFNATSIDTIRGFAPLPGRGVRAGLRIDF